MWDKDAKTGKQHAWSKPFVERQDAIDFAKKNGLQKRHVKSRPAGYVVERPLTETRLLKFNQFINLAENIFTVGPSGQKIKNAHLKSPHHATLSGLGLTHTGTGKTDSHPMYKYDGPPVDQDKIHKAMIKHGYETAEGGSADDKHHCHTYYHPQRGIGLWVTHIHTPKKNTTSTTEIDFHHRIKSNGALAKHDNG